MARRAKAPQFTSRLCRTCGVVLEVGRLCTSCWEVESRLPEYLQSSLARRLVRRLADEAEASENEGPPFWCDHNHADGDCPLSKRSAAL